MTTAVDDGGLPDGSCLLNQFAARILSINQSSVGEFPLNRWPLLVDRRRTERRRDGGSS